MIEQFLSANLAITSIDERISSSTTEIVLKTGAGALFPSPVSDQYFMATLSVGALNEIVRVTNRTGDVVTVVRAQENTIAQSWPVGSLFAQKWTALQAQAVVQKTMLRPTVEIEFEDGAAEVQIDLSKYDFLSSGILVKMFATEEKLLTNIVGLSESVQVILYVDESSDAIGVELDTPPFFLSNIYGDYGWPGYPRTTLSLLHIPDNDEFTWIETGRTQRIS